MDGGVGFLVRECLVDEVEFIGQGSKTWTLDSGSGVSRNFVRRVPKACTVCRREFL